MPRHLIPDHLQQIWVGLESTHGEGPADLPVAADAIDHISLDAPLMRRRVEANEEQTGNRGPKPSFRGAVDPVAVRILAYLRGSGSAGTAPPVGKLLRAAGFTETVNVGVDVTYTRALEPEGSAWLWAAHRDGSEGRCYSGVAITEIQVPDAGTQAARIEVAGNAARGAAVYKTTVGTGGIDNQSTALPLAPGHGWTMSGAPAWIEVSDGESTEIMKVTAVDGDVATVVRDVGGTGAVAFLAGDTISAYRPARSVPSTTPMQENLGGFTVDDGGGASGRKIVKASLTVRTGIDLLDKEAFSLNRQGNVAMRYGEDGAQLLCDVIYTRGSDGMVYLHAHADRATDLAVVMTLGSVPGNRAVIAMPRAQVVDIAAPDATDGPRKGTVTFGAFSTDGADISFKFN